MKIAIKRYESGNFLFKIIYKNNFILYFDINQI